MNKTVRVNVDRKYGFKFHTWDEFADWLADLNAIPPEVRMTNDIQNDLEFLNEHGWEPFYTVKEMIVGEMTNNLYTDGVHGQVYSIKEAVREVRRREARKAMGETPTCIIHNRPMEKIEVTKGGVVLGTYWKCIIENCEESYDE